MTWRELRYWRQWRIGLYLLLGRGLLLWADIWEAKADSLTSAVP